MGLVGLQGTDVEFSRDISKMKLYHTCGVFLAPLVNLQAIRYVDRLHEPSDQWLIYNFKVKFK